MRNTIHQIARICGHVLLGILLLLTAALPAGADPTLIYSTFLGGSSNDEGRAIATWGTSTIIAGTTKSLDFPVRFPPSGLSSSKPSGDDFSRDIFVTFMSGSGVPFYSRYIPMGPNHHSVLGVGVGPGGVVYVASLVIYGSDANIAVVRVDPPGRIVWTRETIGRSYAERMTVDPQGNVYVTGHYTSEVLGPDHINAAFVWKLGPDGSTIYYRIIDGNGFDIGRGIAADAAGYAYVTGATSSTNLPNALQAVPVGGNNVFVTKLGPAGEVHWTTYLGGSGEDWGEEIEVAADGTVVLAGTTHSTNFPTLNAIQTGPGGSRDLFVARLQSWGSPIFSTYLGGSGSEDIRDLALDPSSILLAVQSPESGSPLREPLDPACGDSFVAKLDAQATEVLDAACLGSSIIYGVAADSSGISLTGAAASDLPLANAWQPAEAGGGDAFVAKLTLNHPPDCSTVVANPNTLWPANGSFVDVQLSGATDPEGDPVSLALTSIFQDEFYTSPGTPDATGLGTSTARLRASRINGGNGRVYHLRFTATDSRGETCSGLVKVCVPPQQGGTCIDGGARVDSTRAY